MNALNDLCLVLAVTAGVVVWAEGGGTPGESAGRLAPTLEEIRSAAHEWEKVLPSEAAHR